MKYGMKTSIFLIFTTLIFTYSISAQTNSRSSSKSAAQYDAVSIDENISDNRDVIYFSQMAIDRGTMADTKDLAKEMLEDYTGLLYSMEQLATAGGKGEHALNSKVQEIKDLNEKLTQVRGFSFDTAWIGGVLRMQQVNLNQLNEQKLNATNERLKAAVSEAIPVLKRYITRLSTLQKQLIKRDLQEKKEAAKQQAAMEKKRKSK